MQRLLDARMLKEHFFPQEVSISSLRLSELPDACLIDLQQQAIESHLDDIFLADYTL